MKYDFSWNEEELKKGGVYGVQHEIKVWTAIYDELDSFCYCSDFFSDENYGSIDFYNEISNDFQSVKEKIEKRVGYLMLQGTHNMVDRFNEDVEIIVPKAEPNMSNILVY